MKLFVDSATVTEIENLVQTGLVDGVTTNPSLIAKAGGPFSETIQHICNLVQGPVSVETTATDASEMIREGRQLADIADNINVKVPMTWEGLKACRELTRSGTSVNLTLCFSVNQALLAAKAGASFVSPFIGRLDDIGLNGTSLIREIKNVYDNYEHLSTHILAASIRSVNHVKEAALAGADIATIPPAVLRKLVHHPLTEKGIKQFLDDWRNPRLG